MNVFWCKRKLGQPEETHRTWGEHTIPTQKDPCLVVSCYDHISWNPHHLLLSLLSLERGIPLLFSLIFPCPLKQGLLKRFSRPCRYRARTPYVVLTLPTTNCIEAIWGPIATVSEGCKGCTNKVEVRLNF
jgi:hypothetical protein